jgi:hypothetical protein
MPSYSRDFILDRVKDKKDAGRAAKTDKLIAQATQPPHEDDAAARSQLLQLAGDDSTGAWATNDARNYTRMRLSEAGLSDQLPEQFRGYSEAKDGRFSLGKAFGDFLEYAAPIAAMAIPGVGPLAAAGIAAAGTTAGRAISGDPFSLKSTLLSGAGGAGGNLLLGGQGLGGISGIPGRLGLGGAGASAGGAPAGLGPQGIMAPGGGTIGAVGQGAAGSGFSLGKGLDFLERYGPLAVGGLSAYQSAKDQSAANALRERGIKMAEQDYAAREPFRTRATEFARRPEPTRPDLASVFYDEGNPFNRVKRPEQVA